MVVEGGVDWTPPPAPPAAPVTPAELLTFMGAASTPDNDAWATDCVAAVWAAACSILDRSSADLGSPAIAAELRVATLYASATAYKRREALFGTAAYVDPTSGAVVRVPADYAETVRGILDRYSRLGFA